MPLSPWCIWKILATTTFGSYLGSLSFSFGLPSNTSFECCPSSIELVLMRWQDIRSQHTSHPIYMYCYVHTSHWAQGVVEFVGGEEVWCPREWKKRRKEDIITFSKTKIERDRDIPHTEACSRPAYNYGSRRTGQFIPFSAFWLRSSVVSVLISLISDTWPIRPHDINLISFMGAAPVPGSLLSVGAACVASVLHWRWGNTGAPPSPITL